VSCVVTLPVVKKVSCRSVVCVVSWVVTVAVVIQLSCHSVVYVMSWVVTVAVLVGATLAVVWAYGFVIIIAGIIIMEVDIFRSIDG